MKIVKIGFAQKFGVKTLQKKENQQEQNFQSYKNVPSFWGQDLVVCSGDNKLPAEIRSKLPKGIPFEKLILQAQSEENKIGEGANSVVYNIPHLEDYVLKVFKEGDVNGVEITEFPENINLGQPVWKDEKSKKLLIMKKIKGREHSIPVWTKQIEHSTPVTKQQAKQFVKQLSTIAQMPQRTFDVIASEVKLLDDMGYKLDSINPNNLLVDEENAEIHIIDYFKVAPHETHLYKNSCFDLIAVIADFTLFDEYFDKLDYSDKQILLQSARTVADKVHMGSKKAGLSCDLGRYITYINKTSLHFHPANSKKEAGREYIRAYDYRMNDFLAMLTDPKHWAQKR